jgi:hypothetical protein
MVGKSQTTLAGRQRLRVVNFRLSQPPFPGQFSVITTISFPETKTRTLLPWRANSYPAPLD